METETESSCALVILGWPGGDCRCGLWNGCIERRQYLYCWHIGHVTRWAKDCIYSQIFQNITTGCEYCNLLLFLLYFLKQQSPR